MIVHIPKLDHPERPDVLTHAAWAQPRNADELVAALVAAAGMTPWSVTSATGHPVAEALYTPSGVRVMHVLNADLNEPCRDLELEIFSEKAPASVRPLSPARDFESIPFEFDEARKRVRFSFKELQRYVLFKIE